MFILLKFLVVVVFVVVVVIVVIVLVVFVMGKEKCYGVFFVGENDCVVGVGIICKGIFIVDY